MRHGHNTATGTYKHTFQRRKTVRLTGKIRAIGTTLALTAVMVLAEIGRAS